MGLNLVLPVSLNSTGGLVVGTAAGSGEGQLLDFAALFASQLLGELGGDSADAAPEETLPETTDPSLLAGSGEQPEDDGLAMLAPYLGTTQNGTPGKEEKKGTDSLGEDDQAAELAAGLLAAASQVTTPPPAQGAKPEAAPSGGSIAGLGGQTPQGATQIIADEQAATANLAAETPADAAPRNFSDALASANAAQGANTRENSAAETASTAVKAHIADPAWKHQFSEQIVWQAKNELQTAQLHINPPQLGPVQISLSLSGDQASAVFASPHAEVRQAIEDALPKLREMLSASGISLGDANVGAQLPQRQQESQDGQAGRSRSTGETAILSDDVQSGATGLSAPLQRGRGLVDLFA